MHCPGDLLRCHAQPPAVLRGCRSCDRRSEPGVERGAGRLDDVVELHGWALEQVRDIGRQHRPDVTPDPGVQRCDDPSLEPDAFLIQATRDFAERGVEFLADRGQLAYSSS
jgi:hypothetical protein